MSDPTRDETDAEVIEAGRKAVQEWTRKESRKALWILMGAIVAAPLLMAFWRTIAEWVLRVGADSSTLFVIVGIVLFVAAAVVFWPAGKDADV